MRQLIILVLALNLLVPAQTLADTSSDDLALYLKTLEKCKLLKDKQKDYITECDRARDHYAKLSEEQLKIIKAQGEEIRELQAFPLGKILLFTGAGLLGGILGVKIAMLLLL